MIDWSVSPIKLQRPKVGLKLKTWNLKLLTHSNYIRDHRWSPTDQSDQLSFQVTQILTQPRCRSVFPQYAEIGLFPTQSPSLEIIISQFP